MNSTLDIKSEPKQELQSDLQIQRPNEIKAENKAHSKADLISIIAVNTFKKEPEKKSLKAPLKTIENKNKIARVHLLAENSKPVELVMDLQSSQSILDTMAGAAVTTGKPWIQGFEFVWSDRSVSLIKDISFAGISILGRGYIGKTKIGEPISSRLRLPDGSYLPLQLVIHKISADEIDFVFENPVAGRVIVEQSLKDQIISKNIRRLTPTKLFSQNKPKFWFHGPFDTNILIWTSDETESETTAFNGQMYDMNKVIIEYDHVVLIFEKQQKLQFHFSMAKSQASCESGQNYFSPLFDPKVSRVSLGASYINRLIKVLQTESIDGDSAKLALELVQELTMHLQKNIPKM